jgi:hypothetical protein
MRGERTVGVVGEFHVDSGGRKKLFSLWVFTEHESAHDGKTYRGFDGYDVEWSKYLCGYIYHNSSSGGRTVEVSGPYFASGQVDIKEAPCTLISIKDKPPYRGKATKAVRRRNRTRRLSDLPKAFDSMQDFSDLFDWMRQNAREDEAVWCSECRDHLPGEDLCQHCWWCDASGWYSTPDERCKCKEREECRDDG